MGADVFMTSIEVITSKEKVVTVGKEEIMVKVSAGFHIARCAAWVNRGLITSIVCAGVFFLAMPGRIPFTRVHWPSELASVLTSQGKLDEAERAAREAVDGFKTVFGESDRHFIEAKRVLQRCKEGSGASPSPSAA